APLMVLHVGVEKTGTTALQSNLEACKGWAESQGVSTFVTLRRPSPNFANSNFMAHFVKMQDPSGHGEDVLLDDQVFNETMSQLQSCEEKHRRGETCRVVTSSEGWAEVPDSVWMRLLQRLKGWDVRVFIMHRDYSSWLRSDYAEMYKPAHGDVASNPMSGLEYLAGRASVIAPGSVASRVERAFHSLCGTPQGPSHCEIQPASYDHFLSNGQDEYEYLVLNVTLALQGEDFTARNHSLWQACARRDTFNPSSQRIQSVSVGVGIVRMLADRHFLNSCTLPFKMTAYDEPVLALASQGGLPTYCVDVEELMRGDAGLWQQFAGVASRRSGERLCFLSEHSLDASAWEKIRKLAPPCHSK
ncbi:unnamed protein product, partial [Symbiodinium pilosum]